MLSEDAAVKEVYAWSGLALYYAQVLEHALVNLIVVATGDNEDLSSELEDWDGFFEKYFRKMMFKLIRIAGERAGVGKDLVQDLEVVRKRRNFLAHEFFRANDTNFLHVVGQQKMVMELHSMIAQCQNATQRVDELTFEIGAAHGITASLVAEMVAEMRKEARGS